MSPGNPLPLLLAQVAIEALGIVARDPEARACLRELVGTATAPGPVVDANRLLTKAELAKALSRSIATVDRLDREPGAPFTYCGDAKRYSLPEYRSWLASRGKKASKAPHRPTENVDVDDVIQGSQLRVVR